MSGPRIFEDGLLRELAARHGTPLYVYDLDRAAARFARLSGFDVVRYAQKANPLRALLERLRAEGARLDAVSSGEIERGLRAGFAPEEIVYTADVFDGAALALVAELPVGVNVGSPGMLDELAGARPGSAVTVRINPGFGGGHDHRVSTGGVWSKHGVWHADLPDVLAHARALGLEVTGLHVHVGSGAGLELIERSGAVLSQCGRLVGASLESLSAGGGLPVPYRADDSEVDVARYARSWRMTRDALAAELGRPLTLETEPGRYLVADCGVLLSQVRATKRVETVDYVLVDAGFHTLARPLLYGSYHALSLVGREEEPTSPKLVAGPLCESADLFTQGPLGRPDPRPLPDARPGDLLCIHDAGAYGASMASNYNSQPLPAEVVVEGGVPRLARRRQTPDDLLALEVDATTSASTDAP